MKTASFFLFLLFIIFQSCKQQEKIFIQPNPIITENQHEGTDEWLITGVEKEICEFPEHHFCRREEIEGYCSHQSIISGDTLTLFVSTNPVSEFTVDIYRMGYYKGKGGRKMISSGKLQGIIQKDPDPDPETNLFECDWVPSYSILIPEDWISGIYVGKLIALKDSSQAYVIFILRDNRKTDFLFQCSDMTWQAYNRWPYWHSIYDAGNTPWNSSNEAVVSFNRPYSLYVNLLPSDFNPMSNGAGEFFLWEFPLYYWMEKEGYDVSYISNIDVHLDRAGFERASAFISVGHDEYWTGDMLENVTRARDNGLNLLFLSGNSVCYDMQISPSADGTPAKILGKRQLFENEKNLLGATSYGVGYSDFVCKMPDHWLFEGTGMKRNDTIPDLIGWEYHGVPLKNDPTLVVLASSDTFNNSCCHSEIMQDYTVTLYQTPKNNFVFNAATCWWSMPLSSPPGFQNPMNESLMIDFSKDDKIVQQMTRNLFKKVIEK